jgi:hypothetical protein
MELRAGIKKRKRKGLENNGGETGQRSPLSSTHLIRGLMNWRNEPQGVFSLEGDARARVLGQGRTWSRVSELCTFRGLASPPDEAP